MNVIKQSFIKWKTPTSPYKNLKVKDSLVFVPDNACMMLALNAVTVEGILTVLTSNNSQHQQIKRLQQEH